MAMKKKIEQPSGAVPQYWQVGGIRASRGEVLQVRVDGYLTEKARRDGKTKVTSVFTPVDPEVLTRTPDRPMSIAEILYHALHETEDWEKAEAILEEKV